MKLSSGESVSLLALSSMLARRAFRLICSASSRPVSTRIARSSLPNTLSVRFTPSSGFVLTTGGAVSTVAHGHERMQRITGCQAGCQSRTGRDALSSKAVKEEWRAYESVRHLYECVYTRGAHRDGGKSHTARIRD